VRILISGICGFVGSALARALRECEEGFEVAGFDNFARPGSELNRVALRRLGVGVTHGDVRSAADVDAIPAADVVIDAAANPSVLAGVDGLSSSRQVVEHNLLGTVNLLEYCRRHGATFTLLSTSRVYSVRPLASLPVSQRDSAFVPDLSQSLPPGVSESGVNETFSTSPPTSLYGSTKVASEHLALEYGEAFGFPVWINRCGVLAGAGQFGRPDQGIFSFWINSWLRRRPLQYIGFNGEGFQTRDCLQPRDLLPLLRKQWAEPRDTARPRVVNVSGGAENSMSLAQLSRWCEARFGSREVGSDPTPRAFDIPWMVLDSSLARDIWGWTVETRLNIILEEIARHAEAHEAWLEVSES
jgi:CDP-paratose 2-epimerase